MDYDTVKKTEVLALMNAYLTTLAGDVDIALITGDLDPNPDTTLAEIVAAEPTGSWYARIPGVYGEVYETVGGALGVNMVSQQFNYTGVSAPETVTGWAVIAHTVPRLISARRLNTPVEMASVLDSAIVAPGIKVPMLLAS